MNGGVCMKGTCECPNGFSGVNCEFEDLCITQSVGCQNGGVCMEGTCECPNGFSGVNCEFEEWREPFEGTYALSGYRAYHDWITNHKDTFDLIDTALVEIRQNDNILTDSTAEIHIWGLECIMKRTDSSFLWKYNSDHTTRTMRGNFYELDSLWMKRSDGSSRGFYDQTIILSGHKL